MPPDDASGSAADPGWAPVTQETWSDFYMVLRSVLAELPPGVRLLLGADDDARVAHVTARPAPHVEVRAGERRLASLSCGSLTDVLEHVRANVEDHWDLAGPSQLSYTYEGSVSPRLRAAFTGEDLVADLPEVDSPGATAHSTGDEARQDLGGRLDAETLEKLEELRRLGGP